MRSDPATLVPPRRLGSLLRQSRVSAGLGLQELASGTTLTVVELDDIEHGRRLVDDQLLKRLVALYGVEEAGLLPTRSRLVIDLDEGRVSIDDQDASAPGELAEADSILARYLALVYHLRELPIGAGVSLRDADVDVLATALGMAPEAVVERLTALMADEDAVARDQRRIRRRLLMPLVGVVVAAVSSGVLLLVSEPDDEGPADTASEGSAGTVGAIGEALTDIGTGGAVVENPGVAVELGTPAVETNTNT